MTKRQKGFSLIELLIVVAIILIIAAIAIPNLLRARMSANESSAVGTLHTMETANTGYNETRSNQYSPTITELGGPAGVPATCDLAEQLDNTLTTTGQKSGYNFSYLMSTPLAAAPPGCANPGGYDYAFTAKPITWHTTGENDFCVATDGVIRYDQTDSDSMAAAQTATACEAFNARP